MTLDSSPVQTSFRSTHVCEAYNEAAFRHFLAVERARAKRSQRPVFLVVTAIRRTPGRSEKLSDATAAAMFRALVATVREVDFIGWYREGHAAGAVLAQGPQAIDRRAAPLITERLTAELKKRLSPSDAMYLHVRVTRLGGRAGMSLV